MTRVYTEPMQKNDLYMFKLLSLFIWGAFFLAFWQDSIKMAGLSGTPIEQCVSIVEQKVKTSLTGQYLVMLACQYPNFLSVNTK